VEILVDDLLLYAEGDTDDEAQLNMVELLAKVLARLEGVGMKIHPDKVYAPGTPRGSS
jgi:hypothetical protein